MVNQLSDYDLKTYDGHTDVSTLTQVIALWKLCSDYLVLYIRFQRVVNMSLPCVKALPPQASELTHFLSLQSRRLNRAPAIISIVFIPYTCLDHIPCSSPSHPHLRVKTSECGFYGWRSPSLSLCCSLKLYVRYLYRSVLAPSNILSCIIAISPWVFALLGCRALRR